MPTLISVTQNPRRGDQVSAHKSTDAQGLITETSQETWTVVYDGIVDKSVVRSAADLPVLGALTVGGTFVSGVTPTRRTDSPYVWDVLVETTTKTPTSTSNVWNIRLNRGSQQWTQPCYEDRLQKPFCNVIGDLLPQQPTETHVDGVITVSWSTSVAPDTATTDDCLEKVNSDAVNFTICGLSFSFEPRQMKLVGAPVAATRTVQGVNRFGQPINKYNYDCELSFQTRLDKFGPWRAPHEGFRGYANADAAHTDTFRDPPNSPHGTPKSSPTRMDEEGKPLADGADIVYFPDVLNEGDGRGEIEDEVAFQRLFTGIQDSDQVPPQS